MTDLQHELQLADLSGGPHREPGPTTLRPGQLGHPSVVGQTVTFTATLSSSASGETGTVQFDDNGVTIGSGSVSGGQAQFQTSSLALGGHPITAIYEGDDNFVGGSSTTRQPDRHPGRNHRPT